MSLTEKAEGAFRTIGELAKELAVPQHILRYWETKFSQLKPLTRAGNRRYYRPDDVALARRIHDLLYRQGYTVKGVQKLLATKTSAPAAEGQPAPVQPTPPAEASQPAHAPRIILDDLKQIRAKLAAALAE